MSQEKTEKDPVAPELLAILVCPKCRSKIELNAAKDKIVCTNPDCKREYRIEDGIPVMLIED